ncbi:MAG: hypothetical protein A3G41_06205 [Elusimicrobia bacterium RIFCSPLOWO2_12_FULL_59_9]|nr:MAG: hypothetical protein A3G41_06205 [Elusimicrobia bacterium RIFCSPLOWO2_12_FULL_59_9]
MTDDLRMGAIARSWSPPEAGLLAVKAGADMLLVLGTPNNYRGIVDAVKKAVLAGEIPEKRLDKSVRRILNLKKKAELLTMPLQAEIRNP